jgi:hypothetical protein
MRACAARGHACVHGRAAVSKYPGGRSAACGLRIWRALQLWQTPPRWRSTGRSSRAATMQCWRTMPARRPAPRRCCRCAQRVAPEHVGLCSAGAASRSEIGWCGLHYWYIGLYMPRVIYAKLYPYAQLYPVILHLIYSACLGLAPWARKRPAPDCMPAQHSMARAHGGRLPGRQAPRARGRPACQARPAACGSAGGCRRRARTRHAQRPGKPRPRCASACVCSPRAPPGCALHEGRRWRRDGHTLLALMPARP